MLAETPRICAATAGMVDLNNGGGFPGAVALWESGITVSLADELVGGVNHNYGDLHNNFPLDVLAMDPDVSAVPEPATFALGGFGALVMIWGGESWAGARDPNCREVLMEQTQR